MEEENIKLFQIAYKAREFSYSPYSDFKVGAAVLTDDNMVFVGTNIENRSYGATICAERVALYKAVSEGKRNIKKLAIASDSEDITYPCGLCLQVIAELMPNGSVIVGTKNDIKEYKISELMPFSFDNKF
jgi:cytidine deaminase